jgi:hypothetical protein
MYNPELLYYNSNDFSIQDNEGLDELFEGEEFSELEVESLPDEGEAEGIFGEEEIDETEDFFEEASLYDELLDEDDTDDSRLAQLTEEINRETSLMSEYEAEYYVEERMAEFWPALIAALPAIIDIAPKAINAIKSVVQKKPQAAQPAPTKTAVANAPATTKSPIIIQPIPQSNNTGADTTQIVSVLKELIQSPKFLELMAGMATGKKQTVTTNTGQQINDSNILGVISSLAGVLASGSGKKEDTESAFPEYVVNNEGAFLIDPHNALQEAELILELIN